MQTESPWTSSAQGQGARALRATQTGGMTGGNQAAGHSPMTHSETASGTLEGEEKGPPPRWMVCMVYGMSECVCTACACFVFNGVHLHV